MRIMTIAALVSLIVIGLLVTERSGLTEGAVMESPKNILVVLSSENKITLKDGVEHATGFFLLEYAVPAKMLNDAGFTLVYANPRGTKAVVDRVSNVFWFDKEKGISAPWYKSEEEFLAIREFCVSEGLCNQDPNNLVGTRSIMTLAEVSDNLDKFAGVFVPGGHAPMEDLWKNATLGKILRFFNKERKPTALICHGPIALLSALDDPEGYIDALTRDNRETMALKTKEWIYRDYEVSSFTTREEIQEEPQGADNALGGYVRFYPDEALEKAGAFVSRADKWQNKISVHKELITGQNPFSDKALGKAFLEALIRADN